MSRAVKQIEPFHHHVGRGPAKRNYHFDFLRLVFATLVLLAHAPEITDGNRSREIFSRLTHSKITLGIVGVDGFFLLSGYLIVQSWERDPEFLNFLRKRALRIIPGYAVAALLSTVIVGFFAPGVSHFFTHLDRWFVESILILGRPLTPSVFPGLAISDVNGSLWTIPYEVRCYLLVAASGLLGVIRRPYLWLAITVVLVSFMSIYALQTTFGWHSHVLVLGDPDETFRLFATYFVGGCFYLFRNKIRFRRLLVFVAVIVILGADKIRPDHLEPVLVVCGAYITFYFVQSRVHFLGFLRRVPDISYGIYLYGWPVESFWIWYIKGSPWIAFAASTVIVFGIGWVSWHFVERPMLTLKRRPTASLKQP